MPTPKCCFVPGCKESGGMHSVHHGFPNPDKEKERFNIWLNSMGGARGLDKYYIYKLRRVCHNHFERKYLCRNDRISRNAVPTLNLPDPSKSSDNSENDPEFKRQRLEHKDHTYNADIDHIEPPPRPDKTLNVYYPQKVYVIKSTPNLGGVEPQAISSKDEPFEDHAATDTEDDTEQVQFSWQYARQINLDDDVDSIFGDGPSTAEIKIESQSAGVGVADIKNIIKDENHTEYICDSCTKVIIGFRYTCVQCENYDLCCECEGKLRHAFHYMLRVPENKPFSEVKSILEAVKEKIKRLKEEARKESTDADLEFDEIKLEEPQFVEVTVDLFSDVTAPADDPTSVPCALTNDTTSHTMPANDIRLSDTNINGRTYEKSKTPKNVLSYNAFLASANNTRVSDTNTRGRTYERPKAPRIVSPPDSFLETLDKDQSSIQKTRDAVSHNLDCRVELTRLPEHFKQRRKVPGTSHSNDQPVIKVLNFERLHSAHGRNQDYEARIFEDVTEEPGINTLAVLRHKMESVIPRKQKPSDVEDLHSESQEYLDEICLEGETETPQNSTSNAEKNRENKMDTQFQKHVEEIIWLDDTLLEQET